MCGPAMLSYDGLRRLHIEARALLVKAASPSGVTVGDLLDMIDRLTAAARSTPAREASQVSFTLPQDKFWIRGARDRSAID